MERTKQILSVFLSFCVMISCMVGISVTAYATEASVILKKGTLSSGVIQSSGFAPLSNDIVYGTSGAKITANGKIITKIVMHKGSNFTNSFNSSGVGVSPGTANYASNTITVTNINSSTVSLSKLGNINVCCSSIDVYYDSITVTGVTLAPSTAQIINVGGSVSFTATIIPNNATDKKVKWSTTGGVTLYSDSNCTQEVGTAATSTLTVYAKGTSAGPATVTATSNADSNKTASCDVTVNPAHEHSFTYAADGATITATCTAGCPDSYNTTPATLTIAAAGGTYDGTTAYSATVTNNIPAVTGDTVGDVAYYKVDTQGATTGGTVQTGAPTGAGYYYASVTLTSGSNTYTAVKAFTVAKIDPTAPTGLNATYGQKLSDVVLTTGWTWTDSTQSVGSVGSNTFKANFAGDDNYNAVSNVDVSVTVGKAANPATVTGTASVTKGSTVDLSANVTKNGATGAVSYAIDGNANGCTLNGSVLTSGSTTGTVTVNVTIAEDDNYNALAATPITVTISDKATQTITAADVIATYGDTGTF